MDFPLWLLLAITSPFFWAIVIVLDTYCVNEVFDNPVLASIASGLTMMTALPFLCMGFVFIPWESISIEVWGLSLTLGFLFMTSQFLYFKALTACESGIVAAYWNLTPVLVLVGGWVLLGEILTVANYAGAILIIFAAFSFCLLDSAEFGRIRTFVTMALGCVLMAGYFLLQKPIFDYCSVYQTFVLSTFGMAVVALLPLCQTQCRKEWRENWPRIRSAIPFLLVIEVSNLAAVALSQYAVSLGPTTLVAAVEACLPAYTFGISICLWAIFRKFGEEEARNRILAKLALVGAMAFGVILVS